MLVFGAAHLLALATPLRVTPDAMAHLTRAWNVAAGLDYEVDGPTNYPRGYAYTVATLDRAGLANATGLVALNLAAVGGALLAAHALYRRHLGLSPAIALGLVAFTLVSFVVVKHAALAGSDPLFLGLAATSVLAMAEGRVANGARRSALLAAALALAAAALAVRTAGVALLPVLALVLVERGVQGLREILSRDRLALGAAVLVAVAGLGVSAVVLARSRYGRDALGVSASTARSMLWRGTSGRSWPNGASSCSTCRRLGSLQGRPRCPLQWHSR